MNKNRIVSLLLLSTLISTFAVTNNSIPANAAEKPSISVNHTDNEKGKISEQDLTKIEEKYLVQNSEGTFSLKDSIHNEYDANTVDFLENNMSAINKLILQGNLKYKKMIHQLK